ncbi:hypothetical protein EBZ37_12275 [bacterium]|nr:hypothetical protein [bacterium]
MSVLLVCSLEIKPISTYIIILPAFISLFVLLMCVCGVWCCLATVDADGLEKAATEGGAYMPPGSGGDTEGSGSGAGAELNEGEAVVVITPIEAEAAPVIAPVSAPPPAPVAAIESVAPASPTDVGLDELVSTEVPVSTETTPASDPSPAPAPAPAPARAPAPVSVSLNAEELD